MFKIHYYKGYAIHKPEGCKMWNIHKVDYDGMIDWCFAVGFACNLKEARTTIDYWESEKTEYRPCATRGDYSPSSPWNAPGMSIKDFI